MLKHATPRSEALRTTGQCWTPGPTPPPPEIEVVTARSAATWGLGVFNDVLPAGSCTAHEMSLRQTAGHRNSSKSSVSARKGDAPCLSLSGPEHRSQHTISCFFFLVQCIPFAVCVSRSVLRAPCSLRLRVFEGTVTLAMVPQGGGGG